MTQQFNLAITRSQCQPDYRVHAKASGDNVELLMHGIVGDSDESLDSLSVAGWLSQHRDKSVTVRINSPGGFAYDGIAIANALSAHPKPTKSIIEGVAASAAAIVAVATDERVMFENSQLMIHRAWCMAMGNADDLSDAVQQLHKLDGQLTAFFAHRTGQPADIIRKWLKGDSDGTWFDATEALDAGFVDRIQENKRALRFANEAVGIKIRNRLLEMDGVLNG